MNFTLETSHQYDATKYTPLGTVIHNNVEGVSFFRAFIGAFQGVFGGKNGAIQTAVDKLIEHGITEFRNKVSATYPNTIKVVGLHTAVTEAGGEDQQTFLILHITGTCLAPFGQTGGKHSDKKRSDKKRSDKKRSSDKNLTKRNNRK